MNQSIQRDNIIQKFNTLVENSLNDQNVKKFNEHLTNLDSKDKKEFTSLGFLIKVVIDLDPTSFMKKIYPKLTEMIRKNLKPPEFTDLVENMLNDERFFEEILNQKFKPLVEKSLNDLIVKELKEILKSQDFENISRIINFSVSEEEVSQEEDSQEEDSNLDPTSFINDLYKKLIEMVRKNLDPHEFKELEKYKLENKSFLEEIVNQNYKPLIKKNLNVQIVKNFKEYLKNLNFEEDEEKSNFSDSVELIFKSNPPFFMKSVYPKFLKMIRKVLEPHELKELENYLIKSSFIKEIVKQKFESLVEKKDDSQIVEQLQEILKNLDTQLISSLSFIDLVGKVLELKPKFFMKRVYPKFLEMIRKILDPYKLRELKNYLFKNTIFLQEIVNQKFLPLVKEQKYYQIVKEFKEILRSLDFENFSEMSYFSDLAENVFKLYTPPKMDEVFLNEVYPKFLKMIRKYLEPHELKELEKNMLENTSFLEKFVELTFEPLVKFINKTIDDMVQIILKKLDFKDPTKISSFRSAIEKGIKLDPTSFMKKGNHKFLKMIRKYLEPHELKELEKKMLENKSFLEEIVNQNFKPLINVIDEYIDLIVMVFEKFLKKPDFYFLSSLSFSALVEKVFKLDRDFFKQKVYPKFLKMIRKYLEPHELTELEKSMLENTSILKVIVKDKFIHLVKKKQNDQIVEQFQKILDTQLLSSGSFSALVEKVSNLNPTFFMKSVYPKFLEMIKKTLDPRELKELEKHMLENTSFLEVTTGQKFKPLVEKKQNDQIVTKFKKILKNLDVNEISEMSSFNVLVEEVFKIDPNFFMQKVYIKFQKMIRKVLDPDKLKELEKYILKNTSFSDQEKFIFDCEGEFIQKIENTGTKVVFVDARIYFTNVRIIIHSDGIRVGPVDAPIKSYFGNSYMKKYYENMIIIRNFYHSKPCFGYEFPILALHDIEKTKSHVEYNFHQSGKNYFCEISPKKIILLKDIKKIFNKLNTEDLSNNKEGKQCGNCERLIKSNHQFCKHCGQKLCIDVF